MRFDQFSIPAFGSFTDFSLKFDKSPANTDLHLIYGPNEAGKSTLLRAINQMLYGIPTRSTDTFLHPGSKMLAGATVSEGAQTLSFLRKKGNKNTLLDPEKNSIEDDSLDSFLGAIDENFFRTMFGLNTESLREGAEDILSGEGDLSTILFSASLGGSPIDDAIKSLENEANQLYKGTARTNVSILPALRSYQEHEKLAKSTAVKPTAWQQTNKDLQTAEASANQADTGFREHRRRLTDLQNLLHSLPAAQGLKATEQSIDDLKAPSLPSDFIPRVRELQTQIRESQQALQFLTTQEESNSKELDALPEKQLWLDHAASIQTLDKGLVSYQEKQERSNVSTAEIAALQQQRNSLLSQLELDSPAALDALPIPTVEKVGELKKLARSLHEHLDQQAQCKKDLHKLEQRQSKLNKQLAEQPDTTDLSSLESLVTLADQHAKDTATADLQQQDLDNLKKQVSRLLNRLDFPKESDADAVHAIKMLSEETILEYRDHFTEVLKQQQQKSDKLESLTTEHTEQNHLLQQLTEETPIYSKNDLTEARQERDQLWQAVKATPSKASTDQINSLDEAIRHCDTIVDTLYNHAQDIAKAKGIQQQVSLLTKQITDAEKAHDSATQKLDKLQSEWNVLCDSIPLPHTSPNELLEWRKQWLTLCDNLTRCEELKQLIDSHVSQVADITSNLQKSLGSSTDGINDFSKLHSLLKTTIKRANQQQGAYATQQQDLTGLAIEIEQNQELLTGFTDTLKATQQAWSTLCKELALDPTSPPDIAQEILTTREKAHEHASQLQQATDTLKQIKASLASYENDLTATSQLLLDAVQQNLPSNIQVAELSQLLADAQETKVRRQALTDKEKELTLKAAEEKTSSQGQRDALTTLYQQAKIKTAEELETLALTLESKATLTIKADHYRETLTDLAGNKSLDELIAETENADADTVEQELSQLEASSDEVLANRDNVNDQLKSTQAEIEVMQAASDTAAQHKQTAANALSTIVTDVERYIKLQHAIDFLKNQVEAYREKTQGPMIERTSHYFSKLTSDRYSRVVAQSDDKGTPQLLAVRDNNELVATTGLSEGTADQLYLALRLAAIDLHLDKHPPIPLILDDLLVTFDDDRTRALLPVLEELSQKTQILIFTHHHHLTALTKEVSTEIQQHQLSA